MSFIKSIKTIVNTKVYFNIKAQTNINRKSSETFLNDFTIIFNKNSYELESKYFFVKEKTIEFTHIYRKSFKET